MTPAVDPVIRALIALNLTEYEADFRTILAGRLQQEPDVRVLTIAAVAVLMQIGRVPWPYIQQTVAHLEQLPGDALKDEAVGIVNGTHLVVPTVKGLVVTKLADGRTVSDPPPGIVSTLYGVSVIWELISKATTAK